LWNYIICNTFSNPTNPFDVKTKIFLLIEQVERENQNMRVALEKLQAMKKK
jgi:hypothetical protein